MAHEHHGKQDNRRPISTLSCPDQAIIKANSSPAVTVCQAGEARSRQMIDPAVTSAAASMP